MKVLITGAAGYLGRALRTELSPSFDLTLADIVPAPDGTDGFAWRQCDVTQEDAVRELVAGHDAVVHTVAIVRGRENVALDRFLDVMIGGTWNVLDAAATSGVARVVNIPSVAAGGVAGDPDQLARTDLWSRIPPGDLRYSLSKRLGEVAANTYTVTYPELAVVNLRPVMIAGDGLNPEPDPAGARGGGFFYVDVRDLALAVRRCLERDPAPRGTYTITAARPDSAFSWREAERDLGFVAQHNWTEVP